MTDALYLSHGDDPYIGSDIYGVPASGLLLSDATYQAWFVNGPYAAESIGRGNPESMIQNLSGKLQFLYCSDPPNTDPSNSLVLHEFTLFPDVYPLSYLENLPVDQSNPGLPASLWDRLAQKVAVQGGCAATLDAIGQSITATAKVDLKAVEASSTVRVELHPNLVVKEVKSADGKSLNFERDNQNSQFSVQH